MSYKCEVKDLSTQSALSIRTRTSVDKLPQVMGEVYSAVFHYLAESAEEPAGPPFAGYFNMDMQDLDVEIGVPVSKGLPGKEDIKASEIPGGKIATCLYTGPYSEIGSAYTALSQWMEDNGYEPTGVSYEMYVDDPGETPQQELRTEIWFPVKSA